MTGRGGVLAGLALGLVCAGGLACSGNKAMVAPPHTAAPGEPLPPDPRAEIDALDRAIDADLARLSMERPVVTLGGAWTPMSEPPRVGDPQCTPPSTEVCTDACGLADSICASAGRICAIAGDLGGQDRHANDRCESGKASCTAAKQRCCGCT